MQKANSKKIKSMNNSSSISHQPWSTYSEWKSCYDLIFNNSYSFIKNKTIKNKKIEENLDSFINNLNLDNLLIAANLLNIWKIRNENVNLVLTTSLLLEEIIKFIKNISISNEDYKHILSQKIIRVTNLLIDDLKKKNRNMSSNMFIVAKEIDFPEFIVEVRHACTHKNLPQVETLKFVIKYLYLWIKDNIWDKQYNQFIQEIEICDKINTMIGDIKNLNTSQLNKKFESSISDLENILIDTEVKFEIDNLFAIIENLVTEMFKKISMKNKTPFLDNLNEFSKIYKLLQISDGKVIPILIFKFITQQVQLFVKGIFENYDNYIVYIKEKENILQILSYLANFAMKYDIVKQDYRKEDLKILIIFIHQNLNFAKDFSVFISEIFTCFNKITIDESGKTLEINNIKNKSILKDFDIKNKNNDNYLYPNGSLIFDQLNYLTSNKNPLNFYNKQKKIDDGNSDNEENNLPESESNKISSEELIEDDYDFYMREIEDALII